MRKSRLQQEFDKQVRLLNKQLKALQKEGITFNPEDIEAIKKRPARLKQSDIESLKVYNDTLESLLPTPSKSRTRKTEEGKTPTRIKKVQPRKSRTKKEEEPKQPKAPKKKLSPETRKARKNFRARVRRLERQGYDVSKLKPATEYTNKELNRLKRNILSKLVFKDGESAYDIKRRQANERRKATIEFRERIKKAYLEPEPEVETIKPHELGDYIEVGRGALTDRFHDTSIIEELLRRFHEMENDRGRQIEGQKAYLIDLFYDMVNENDDETGKGLLDYEDYLRANKIEIISLTEQIKHDSDDARISNNFARLFEILNQGALDARQKRAISDYQEQIERPDYDYT